MPIKTGEDYGLFWNSSNGDRKYNAESFSELLRKFFVTGVFTNELAVRASTGMQVTVDPGWAFIEGKIKQFKEEDNRDFTIADADATYPRIDTIVVECVYSDRDIRLKYVKGSPSASTPSAPAPVRDTTKYEIVLAHIYVSNGTTSITQSAITDTRLNSELCGLVRGTVDEIDWDDITAQFSQYIEEYKADKEAGFDTWEADRQAEYNSWIDENEADFLAWFDRMKGQLDTDAAGHIQSEIDHINSELPIYTDSEWNENTKYDKHTYVKYNNYLWISLDETIGEEPNDESSVWLKLASAIPTPTTTNLDVSEPGMAIDATLFNPNHPNSIPLCDAAYIYDVETSGSYIAGIINGVLSPNITFKISNNAALSTPGPGQINVIKTDNPFEYAHGGVKIRDIELVSNGSDSAGQFSRYNAMVDVRDYVVFKGSGMPVVAAVEYLNTKVFESAYWNSSQPVPGSYGAYAWNSEATKVYTPANPRKIYAGSVNVLNKIRNAPYLYEMFNYDNLLNMSGAFSASIIRGNVYIGKNTRYAAAAYANSLYATGSIYLNGVSNCMLYGAFENCYRLKGEIIGGSGDHCNISRAFYNCTNLRGDFYMPEYPIFGPNDPSIGYPQTNHDVYYAPGCDSAYYNCRNMNGTIKLPNFSNYYEKYYYIRCFNQSNGEFNWQGAYNYQSPVDRIYHNCVNATAIQLPNVRVLNGIFATFNTTANYNNPSYDHSLWYKGKAPVFPYNSQGGIYAANSFYGQSLMTGIPDIGNCYNIDRAFYNCQNIHGVQGTFNRVSSIFMNEGFRNCVRMTDVNLHTLYKIGAKMNINGVSAFYNCSNLINVHLITNGSVNAYQMFHTCPNIRTFEYLGLATGAYLSYLMPNTSKLTECNFYFTDDSPGAFGGVSTMFNSGLTNCQINIFTKPAAFESSSFQNFITSQANSMGLGTLDYTMVEKKLYNAARNVTVQFYTVNNVYDAYEASHVTQ